MRRWLWVVVALLLGIVLVAALWQGGDADCAGGVSQVKAAGLGFFGDVTSWRS
jgi:hypothetical protein